MLLSCALLLCACGTGKGTDSILWYQEGPAEITGEFVREGQSYTVTVTLGRTNNAGEQTGNDAQADAGTRDVTLTFSAPEALAGMVFRLRGEDAFAVYDTVEIPLSRAAAGEVFAPAALFALQEENITDIQNGDVTVIQLSDGNDRWDVSTDAEGIPVGIRATVDGVDLSFTVTSFVQMDT